jgi:Flp pilus assembly protein TadG
MKCFRKFIRDRTGEAYVDLAIATLIILTLMASLIALFPIFTTQQSLNNTARQLARIAEVTGSAQDAQDTLNTISVLQPDTIQWDTDWQDDTLQTIQLKTPFTVTVTKQVSIIIFRPALSNPVEFDITISASANGISEVYWK